MLDRRVSSRRHCFRQLGKEVNGFYHPRGMLTLLGTSSLIVDMTRCIFLSTLPSSHMNAPLNEQDANSEGSKTNPTP
jgi:hypothetical protein